MVALVVMAFVVSQLLFSYTTQQQSHMAHERVIEAQEEVRLISDLILSDMRMAGFMVPKGAGIGSIDGGTTASDVLCVSDPNIIDPASLDDATRRFDAGETLAAITAGDTTVTLTSSSMDIDSDGNDDFAANQGVLFADGTKAHCAVITDVTGSTLTFDTALPSTYSSSSAIVPALVYRVSGTQLTRNTIVLSNHVEDLQVEFGVDADGDSEIEAGEFPIYDLTNDDLSRVFTARVYLTSRVDRTEPGFAGLFEAASNRDVASAADEYKRRRVISDALLRNLR